MKTLIDKFRTAGRGIRKGILVLGAVTSIRLAGCPLPTPPVNNPPKITSTPPTEINEGDTLDIDLK